MNYHLGLLYLYIHNFLNTPLAMLNCGSKAILAHFLHVPISTWIQVLHGPSQQHKWWIFIRTSMQKKIWRLGKVGRSSIWMVDKLAIYYYQLLIYNPYGLAAKVGSTDQPWIFHPQLPIWTHAGWHHAVASWLRASVPPTLLFLPVRIPMRWRWLKPHLSELVVAARLQKNESFGPSPHPRNWRLNPKDYPFQSENVRKSSRRQLSSSVSGLVPAVLGGAHIRKNNYIPSVINVNLGFRNSSSLVIP